MRVTCQYTCLYAPLRPRLRLFPRHDSFVKNASDMLITLKLLPKNPMQCNAQLENMENLVLNNHNPTLKYNEEIEINKKI